MTRKIKAHKGGRTMRHEFRATVATSTQIATILAHRNTTGDKMTLADWIAEKAKDDAIRPKDEAINA